MTAFHRVTTPAKWSLLKPEGEYLGLGFRKGSMFVRLAGGIRDHFPIRVSEWIMAAAMLEWGWVLWFDPDTFSKSSNLSELARIGDESSWSLVCVLAGLTRLAALVINGTFHDKFKYSPHLRAFAAMIACFLWGQITLGIFVAVYSAGGVLTGLVAYSTFLFLDMWNLVRASADVGTAKANRVA
jgi:hypothetical protein